MNTKQITLLTLGIVALSLIANALLGRYVTLKISTLPLLNRWKIISPQAPVVFNTREVVRVSDTGDVLEAIEAFRSRLSVLVTVQGETVRVLGSAVNLTSDGVFLTGAEALGSFAPDQLWIKLSDGTVAPVTGMVRDPATGVAVLRATASGMPVVSFAESKNIAVGQKLLFVKGSLDNFSVSFEHSYLTVSQRDLFEKAMNADRPAREFGVQAVGNLVPGEAVILPSGEVAGMWDGRRLVPSDILRHISGMYLGGNQQLSRPSFGFSYAVITPAEEKLLRTQSGAKVARPLAGPALQAGLREGDIITQVDGQRVSSDSPLEELLQKYKPGDAIKFDVLRAQDSLPITLTAGTLQ